MLAIPSLDPPKTAAATYLAAALHALAREEHVGRRPPRLLESDHATWQRFRGRLGPRELVELVLEDAAVGQPEPFAVRAVLGEALGPVAALSALRTLPEERVAAWLEDLPRLPLGAQDRDYLDEQAKRLGLLARPAFSELHKLSPHHRVLELPGTGGRLAAYVVAQASQGMSLSFKDMVTVACASWQERMLAGLVAVSLDVRGEVRIGLDPTLEGARRAEPGFTHVFGLKPEKGGGFDAHTLEGFFPAATIVLV